MPTIRNMKDLEKVIQGRLSLALKMTQQEVYKVIQKNITNYYKEKVFKDRETGMMKSTPNVYNRTFQFLNSLIKTKVITQNGVISCSGNPTEILEDIRKNGFNGCVECAQCL